MYTDPIAGGFGGARQGFATQDVGLWTPPDTISPASTRNNSTISASSAPTPTHTPAAAANNAGFGDSIKPSFDPVDWNSPFSGGQDFFDGFDDWMKLDGSEMA